MQPIVGRIFVRLVSCRDSKSGADEPLNRAADLKYELQLFSAAVCSGVASALNTEAGDAMMEIKGTSATVTGAARGIGRGVAGAARRRDPMIKTTELNHSAFRITNVDKSREFYEKVLGLKPLPRPNFSFGGMWYGVGNAAIHLIVSKKMDGPDPTGPHIAIEVDDLDQTKASLKEMGVPFLDGDGMTMTTQLSDAERKLLGRQIWVLDPDGNTIELRKSSK